MDATLKLKAEQLAEEIASQAKTLEGVKGRLSTLLKAALGRRLHTERDVPRGRKSIAALPAVVDVEAGDQVVPANRRNGHSKKTLRGERGELPLDIPRDRDGTFEPLRIPKHQRRLPGFDEKIFALYAKGLTTGDIQEVVKELYGAAVPPTLVSQITAALDAEVTAGQQRRLDPVWPSVYRDGLVVHVRGDSGRVSPHTMYVAIGVNVRGKKDLLGLWLREAEGAKFWLSCLTDLKNRGLNDIFVACVDGLTGFTEAIRAAYPHTKVQLCVVPLVRAALKYVPTADSQPVAADLKTIYQAATVGEAEQALEKFAAVWGAQYPTLVKPWRLKWNDLITLFDFAPPIREAIDTTNALESVNRVIRKFTRNRKQYPNAASALQLVYLAIHEASKRWTRPIKGWKAASNQFAILFEGRLPQSPKN